VIGRSHHLAEERLLECYQAQRVAAPVDPPAAEHLVDCPDCSVRFAELSDFMDALRAEADAEIGDLYPPERLERQRQHIARRIARVGRAAHIISFPSRLVGIRMTGAPARTLPRWTAAAAVACVLAGVALGFVFDTRTGAPAVAPRVLLAPAPVPRTGAAQTMDADTLLSELDTAIRRHTPELMAFEALTPHVREITSEIR
jgi:hypothetical protein